MAERFAGNQLLAALPRDERAHLAPLIEEERLVSGNSVGNGAGDGRLWFPASGAVVLVLARDDAELGLGLVGSEGVAGLVSSRARTTGPLCEEVVVAGRALVMEDPPPESEGGSLPALWGSLQRFHWTLAATVVRAGACHRLHGPVARLARWMLALDARAGSGAPLPARPLALLSGVEPSDLASLAEPLVAAGAIEPGPDGPRILDRARAEMAACPCHQHEGASAP